MIRLSCAFLVLSCLIAGCNIANREYRALSSGVISEFYEDSQRPTIKWFTIGGQKHKVPLRVLEDPERYRAHALRPGTFVVRGTLLWVDGR